jgi:ribosomal-protein-alanine N-acetyltransferase
MLLVARGAPDDPAPLLGFLAAQQVLDELHVLALAAHPGARRRGIGTALLGMALGTARAAGVRVTHLEVRPSNPVAREFYARHGFAVVGCRPRYYPDGEDALLLTLGMLAEPAPRTAAHATGSFR